MTKENIKKLFSYVGSKQSIIKTINSLINQSELSTIYIEPFLGSGSIFLNLDIEFDKYILAEKNLHILNIFQQFTINTFKEINLILLELESKSLIGKKEEYLRLRDIWNTEFKNIYSFKGSVYLWVLLTQVFRGYMRLSKQGNLTSAYGVDSVNLRYPYLKLKERLKNTINYLNKIKHKIIYLDHWEKCDFSNITNGVLFLDPPYYQTSFHDNWKKEDLSNLITSLNFSSNLIMYTDIENEFGEKYFRQARLFNQRLNWLREHNETTKIKSEFLYYSYLK